MNFNRDIQAKPMTIPVHLITGFLGSGKTTLLNRLLASPAMADSAVLINEFGEVPVDHLVVDSIDDEIVVLESGCVCCSIRDDLAGALLAIQEKQEQKRIPPVRRVILETTGIADPLPICQQIMTDELIARDYSNGVIITVVDGVYGGTNLDRHLESVHQIVIADHLIISKSDLTDANKSGALEKRLEKLNPSASILRRDPDSDTGEFLSRLTEARSREDPAQWLSSMSKNLATQSPAGKTGHDARFNSFCLRWREPVAWRDFTAWLEALLIARGEQIFRIKGVLNLQGEAHPTLIQGVQHTFYAPVKLKSRPGEVGSELIFITQDFPKEGVINSIHDVLNIECR